MKPVEVKNNLIAFFYSNDIQIFTKFIGSENF